MTAKKEKMNPVCDLCGNKECINGKDCFASAEANLTEYSGENLTIARAASEIEGRYYMQKTRLEEVILFSKEMNYKKIGIALCVGLAEEAKQLAKFLRMEFEVVSACCKMGGIQKDVLALAKIDEVGDEVMCNPIGQAGILNREGTDLNLICGLCIGHDIQFTKYSQAPVTTFIVKDRVLAHNPVGSLYCRYLRKRFPGQE